MGAIKDDAGSATTALDPVWVSPREGERLIGVSHSTIYRFINDGTLRSVVIGGRRLIAYESIKALGKGAA